MDQPTNGLTRLPQGSLGLLETETARTLLASAIPGRLAYIAADGTPRVVPTWVHWTGQELVMATFVAAPHVARPARRIRDLQANPHVAICIDTQDSPPASLTLRGAVDVQIAPGVAAEYALAARRYLGDEAAGPYLAMLDDPVTKMARISLRPAWVGLLDFGARQPETLGGVQAP